MLVHRHPRTTRTTRSALALGLAVLALAAACSSSGGSDSDKAERTTSTTAATTTTTNPSGTDKTSSTTTAAPTTAQPWSVTAVDHRGEDGKTFSYTCPAGGTAARIWGTETYTDDSSVCTAAVHVGLITFEDGGTVEIEIEPGLDTYSASSAHGVVSVGYGSWDGSFTFPEAPPGTGTFSAGMESWAVTAASLDLEEGETVEVNCSPDGRIETIYGTGTYTADSYICTAAVHHGLIDQADGGSVTIELVAGIDAYEGTTAHGVTSAKWGPYDPAFEFPEDQPAPK